MDNQEDITQADQFRAGEITQEESALTSEAVAANAEVAAAPTLTHEEFLIASADEYRAAQLTVTPEV